MDTAVTTQPCLIEVKGCRQAYHKDANADLVVLDNVNLTLHEGEIVALLGVPVPANQPCCASSPDCSNPPPAASPGEEPR